MLIKLSVSGNHWAAESLIRHVRLKRSKVSFSVTSISLVFIIIIIMTTASTLSGSVHVWRFLLTLVWICLWSTEREASQRGHRSRVCVCSSPVQVTMQQSRMGSIAQQQWGTKCAAHSDSLFTDSHANSVIDQEVWAQYSQRFQWMRSLLSQLWLRLLLFLLFWKSSARRRKSIIIIIITTNNQVKLIRFLPADWSMSHLSIR